MRDANEFSLFPLQGLLPPLGNAEVVSVLFSSDYQQQHPARQTARSAMTSTAQSPGNPSNRSSANASRADVYGVRLQGYNESLSQRHFFQPVAILPALHSTPSNSGVSSVNPFVCPFCSKLSASRYDHEKHVRIHTGEKPFGCTLCFFRTADRSSLAKHRRTHSVAEKGGSATPYMWWITVSWKGMVWETLKLCNKTYEFDET